MVKGKETNKLANGVIFIRAIIGNSRRYEYKTEFAFNRMVSKWFGKPMTAEYWKCERCGKHWKSAKVAAKHSC